ncbi:MAG: leader peptidase (prepilin peptidase) / N-methyltransferase [Acidobacteriota bacterium]|jgi:leader peptidase (prepilin peptidase)/N-methyltransferase|nr:leader peptidase (prepilin peptidase) / N-methyltransferase [Acidobacteriota bacterium]
MNPLTTPMTRAKILPFTLVFIVLIPLVLNDFLGPPGRATLLSASAGAGILAGMLTRHVLRRLPRGATVSIGWCEIPTAILWAFIAARWHSGDIPTWWLPAAVLFAWFAVALTVVDIHERRLPDVITLPAYAVFASALGVAAIGIAGSGLPWQPMMWHAAVGAAAFLVFHAVVHLIHPPALGAGDVKLSGTLGGLLGAIDLAALPLVLALAALATLLMAAAIPGRVMNRWRSGVPHAPGLLAATGLVVLLNSPVAA